MIKVDKSRLTMFMNSKKQYEDVYIKGKPFFRTPAIIRGSKFHEFAEKYWNILEYGDDKLVLPPVKTDDGELNKLIVNYQDFLRKRYEQCKKHNYRFFPTAVERVFETYTNFNDTKIRLKGIIDFYDDYFDNKVIGELKTGNEYPKHEFELNFYRWLLKHFDLDLKYGAIYYPKLHKVSFYKLNKLDEVENAIKEFIEYHKKQGWEN